jgi:hypothetical protein
MIDPNLMTRACENVGRYDHGVTYAKYQIISIGNFISVFDEAAICVGEFIDVEWCFAPD